jgi:ubiquinone/menaquinone biosynthesis C-methylase UbiE
MTENEERIRAAVRDHYGEIAREGCGCAPSSCCGSESVGSTQSSRLGYSPEEIASVPAASDLGLGCGNPQAIASLRPGEVVLDLGSGAGFDCFLAARQVGPSGKVIGVDMTPDMLARARANAEKAGISNVEFRLGEIEHLPVADASIDVVISNCVINLSPDKRAVLHDAFRVLCPGGRLAVSDIVATGELPQAVRDDLRLVSACIGGAAAIADLEAMLREAGFVDVAIEPSAESMPVIGEWAPGTKVEESISSASIRACKPAA